MLKLIILVITLAVSVMASCDNYSERLSEAKEKLSPPKFTTIDGEVLWKKKKFEEVIKEYDKISADLTGFFKIFLVTQGETAEDINSRFARSEQLYNDYVKKMNQTEDAVCALKIAAEAMGIDRDVNSKLYRNQDLAFKPKNKNPQVIIVRKGILSLSLVNFFASENVPREGKPDSVEWNTFLLNDAIHNFYRNIEMSFESNSGSVISFEQYQQYLKDCHKYLQIKPKGKKK